MYFRTIIGIEIGICWSKNWCFDLFNRQYFHCLWDLSTPNYYILVVVGETDFNEYLIDITCLKSKNIIFRNFLYRMIFFLHSILKCEFVRPSFPICLIIRVFRALGQFITQFNVDLLLLYSNNPCNQGNNECKRYCYMRTIQNEGWDEGRE